MNRLPQPAALHTLAHLALAYLVLAPGCGAKSVPANDRGLADAATCPASCDDRNDCTIDSCDPSTHACVHGPLADGADCEDGQACTIRDKCQAGLCYSGPFKACQALDQCHLAGVCDPRSGECTNPIAPAASSPCDDGQKCTVGDQCVGGVCIGTPMCPASGQCDPDQGICMNRDTTTGALSPGFPTAQAAIGIENLTWQAGVAAKDGAMYVTGTFNGSVDLGAGPLVPGVKNNQQVLLAKIDPATLKASWSLRIGDPDDLQQRQVVALGANGAGQVAIVGPLSTLLFKDEQVAAIGPGDVFIHAVDGDTGLPRWLRGDTATRATPIAGLTSGDRLNLGKERNIGGQWNAIAGDPSGDAFVVCGTILQTALAGNFVPATNPYPVFHHGGRDIVVASLAGKTGVVNWVRQIGGTNDETCAKIAVDPVGNIYVAGTYAFGSDPGFGGLPALPMVDSTAKGATGMFLLKLAKDGAPLWMKGFWSPTTGSNGSNFTPRQLLALPDGVALAGSFIQATGIDPAHPFKFADGGNFVAKFQGAGAAVFSVDFAAKPTSYPSALGLLSNGDLLLAGSYLQTALVLGSIRLLETQGAGAYIAKLKGDGGADGTGTFTIARGYGKSAVEDDRIYGALVNGPENHADPDSTILLGSFRQTIDFGAPLAPLSSSSTQITAFLARLSP